MIAASGRFDLPFTCVDSTGAATAPTGTPTGTLVKNGTDLGTTVTVTMTSAQGIASCTIPSDAAVGDRFYIRISAVVSGTTYVVAGPAETCDKTVDSRATQTSLDTLDDYVDSEVAAIKAKTDNLPSDPADQSLLEAAITSATSGLATQSSVNTIDDFLDTEIAAIKAKTDNLPASFPTNFASLGINSSGHISRVTLADTVTTLTGHTAQTGDTFARIGLNGAGLTAIGDTRLANLDAAVSTRLASASYSAAPSASTVASQVRTELTTELGRIDVATSTRLASASYTAPTTPPTASAIASQVRTELTTELGRIDASISSRLSTVGYTAPLDAAGIRTAVGLASANIDTQFSGLADDIAEIDGGGGGSSTVSSFDQTALDQLQGVQFIGPTSVYGEAKQIVAGDDYSGERAIAFLSDAIPDLSTADSITFTARTTDRARTQAIQTTDVTYTTGQLAVALTASDTRVDAGWYDYDIEAVVDGLKQTVIGPKARLVVLEDQTQ